MEVAMPRESSGNIPAPPHLDFETWRELVGTIGGRFNPEGIEPTAFVGSVRPISACGLTAAVVGSNAHRVERTHRDVRLDGANHYFALFHVAGRSAMTHNEEAVRFDVGDVVLVDAARPVTFFNSNASESWKSVALLLPRQSLVSHLGFEPRGGLYRHSGTTAGRLLLDLILNSADGGSMASPADSYMRLAVYDLVGALFAPDDSVPSRHADKLFMRVRGVIKDGFADPDFGPCEAAARAGISLRYLQKLFTQRGSTCNEFIYSFRLDHAAHLLQRRATLGASQALGEIAYACGFRDYRHFARKYRHRFGHAPGACSAEASRAREGTVNYSGQERLS
jgi:AraC family transcriptional regulator, positive regulator of tynA and feaB